LERRARETAGANTALFHARLFESLAEAIGERELERVCQVLPGLPAWVGEMVAALAKQVEK